MQKKLDNSIIVPLYEQLKEAIIESIRSEEYPAGSKIPTEEVFCNMYDISRITIRRAISELVDEGYLVKKQGKGTFVTPKKLIDNAKDRLGFSLTCELNGINVSSKLLKKEVISASTRDVTDLKISKSDNVIHIERLRYTDNSPFMIEQMYLPVRYSLLLEQDLEKESILDLLNQIYGLQLYERSDQYTYHKTLELTSVTKKEAELLQIPPNTPLLLIREAIEGYMRTKQLIIGEKYTFVVS